MKDLQECVERFMEAAGQPYLEKPGLPSDKIIELGLQLIDEEHHELVAACFDAQVNEHNHHGRTAENLAEVADAIADLLYVVTWTGLAFGLPMVEVMDEVQRTNMLKFGPGSSRREDGKVVKPPGWQPPDIISIIKKAMAR